MTYTHNSVCCWIFACSWFASYRSSLHRRLRRRRSSLHRRPRRRRPQTRPFRAFPSPISPSVSVASAIIPTGDRRASIVYRRQLRIRWTGCRSGCTATRATRRLRRGCATPWTPRSHRVCMRNTACNKNAATPRTPRGTRSRRASWNLYTQHRMQ